MTGRATDDTPDPCAEALEQLYHFLHGELTEERRSVISVHLDGCSSCLEVYDFEAELRTLVAQRCRDHVPAELRVRIAGFLGFGPPGPPGPLG